jgi:hypothetical protein
VSIGIVFESLSKWCNMYCPHHEHQVKPVREWCGVWLYVDVILYMHLFMDPRDTKVQYTILLYHLADRLGSNLS